jgi:hypothetical protein
MVNPDLLSPFTELPFYKAHFMDLALWDPFVRHVAEICGYICRRIYPGIPGSYPTFIAELDPSLNIPGNKKIVIKFFGPLFEGAKSFQVERDMGDFVNSHPLPIRSPAILAQGSLAEDWHYLVFEFIPGISLAQARHRLPRVSLEILARQVGQFMKELHRLTTPAQAALPQGTSPWLEFAQFLEVQKAACFNTHQRWGDLPSPLLAQLPGFIPPIEGLLDLASPPHLIHADLTADHLLGRLVVNQASKQARSSSSWESLAIIDWGDSRLGNILYELVALHVDLFRGDKRLLGMCLEAYELPGFYLQDFAKKALSMVMLHQFPMPAAFYAPYADVPSLQSLADGLFGI